MTGQLTTHVLDLSCCKPAQGIVVELWGADSDDAYHLLKRSKTNREGRLDNPLLAGSDLQKGCYELRFYVGEYYRNCGLLTAEPAFLECVPVRFGVLDNKSHYHIPLLISPGGYSTYRGS